MTWREAQASEKRFRALMENSWDPLSMIDVEGLLKYVSAAAIRNVYDNWRSPDADQLQGGITALRKAIQAYPMIPALKAIIAHYRQDPVWAHVRPPFTELPAADAAKAIDTLAQAHGFRLDFAKAA